MSFFKVLSLIGSTVLALLFCCLLCRAEKKYIFKPGSRQAVEVNSSSPTNSSRVVRTQNGYRRTTKSGMSSRRYYRRVPSNQNHQTSKTTRTGSKKKKSYYYADHVEVDGMSRKFQVFVPESYQSSSSVPLMLVFHGLGMGSMSMTAVTGFNGIASRKNFVVAYCQAVGKKWNDGMNNTAGVDDVKYVKKVIAKIGKRIRIDQRHIFAVGLSNGGYFVQMLAAHMPDKIAAVAVVASTVMRQALATSNNAIPIIFFLGTEDPLINWSDGRNRSFGKYAKKLGVDSIDPSFYNIARLGGWMSADDMVAYWVKRNGCHPSPKVSILPDKSREDGMRVKKFEYGSRGNAVALYKIIGGFHSWPGALMLPGVKVRSCQDISASEEIWEFFRRYAW